MRYGEIQEPKKLTLFIFDIDDTLMHTTAKIKVRNDSGKELRSLTNQEFNNYELNPGEHFDFAQFRDAREFFEKSTPIKPMVNLLIRILDHIANKKVIMLTARADFDNKHLFLATFRKHGIDMDQIYVERAGNLPGSDSPASKKAQIVREYLDQNRYDHVVLYDDSQSNIRAFKALEDEYPDVIFSAYLVVEGGRRIKVEGWDPAAFPGDAATIGDDNFVSPVGSIPRNQINTSKTRKHK